MSDDKRVGTIAAGAFTLRVDQPFCLTESKGHCAVDSLEGGLFHELRKLNMLQEILPGTDGNRSESLAAHRKVRVHGHEPRTVARYTSASKDVGEPTQRLHNHGAKLARRYLRDSSSAVPVHAPRGRPFSPLRLWASFQPVSFFCAWSQQRRSKWRKEEEGWRRKQEDRHRERTRWGHCFSPLVRSLNNSNDPEVRPPNGHPCSRLAIRKRPCWNT